MAPTPSASPNITLFRGPNTPGEYVWSPFVTKLEARLRFAGLPYRNGAGSPPQGPRGKIPYVAISDTQGRENPLVLGDSALITEKLVDDGTIADLNAKLSPVEKAHDAGLRALLEDKFYFYEVGHFVVVFLLSGHVILPFLKFWIPNFLFSQEHEKWFGNYYTMRDHVLCNVPYPLRIVLGLLSYRKEGQTLHGQGTGRFSVEELKAFSHSVWENVNALLVAARKRKTDDGMADALFWALGHDEPSEADATLYGAIAGSLLADA